MPNFINNMWDQEKLQEYIDNKVEESITLDYKAAGSLLNTDGKKNEISKDVSAFANSNGGIIIYGMTEQNIGAKHLPDSIDPIDRVVFSKETLEQIINSRIMPTIHGVLIYPITIGLTANNKVVYVVEIPQSDTAHQASDKKYYRRYNFQSIAMEDWEIKDIINRKSRTQAEIVFRPLFPADHAEVWMAQDNPIPMEFQILAINKGQLVIHHIDLIIAGGSDTSNYIYDSKVVNQRVEYYFTNENEHKITLEGNDFTINIQRMPILSKTFREIGRIRFSSEFFKSDHPIRLTISTDDNRSSIKLIGKEVLKSLVKRDF